MNNIQTQGQQQIQTQQVKRLLAMRAKLLIANVQNISMVTRLELAGNILVEDVIDPMVESLESDQPDIGENDFVNEIGGNSEEMGYRMLDDGQELGDIPDDRKSSLVLPYTEAEDLLGQLVDLHFTGPEREIAEAFVHALNEKGFLDEPERMIEFLEGETQSSEDEIRGVLDSLKATLQPAGVFAENVQESLLLQTRRLPDSTMKASLEMIINERYDLLVKQDQEGIAKFLRLDSTEAIGDVLQAVSKFRATPFTGELSSVQQKRRLVDFIVQENNGHFVVHATEGNLPEIVLSDSARRLLYSMQKGGDSEAKRFLLAQSEQLNVTREMLRDRVRKSEAVVETILNHQAAYLHSGDPEKIHVLLQEDIADKVKLHPTTVSRIIANKIVQTEAGATIDLKH